ncbi:MAG: 1-acyl-sn-glycerol-3-phosphate acyltransferase [Actinomycetota bacterium]|nr:1-acyl-sn-glycerol-3-phosphate acyltransferase [Actinomycetota bacterium]
MFRALDLRIDVNGAERIPRAGGAVLASNHVSYLDFIFCGLAGVERGRLTRFMAKQEVFANPVAGPLMRGMHHIPVDRAAGAGSFRRAADALRAGELVGVFPEATISRSFTVKEVKTGAVRLAQQSGTPLIPVALWGGQRLFTKDLPRDLRTRGRPLSIAVGEPMAAPPDEHPGRLTDALRERMQELLERTQQSHPDQPMPGKDAPWHPAHLGGTAPTPERARELDEAERAARAARARSRRRRRT